MFLVLCVSKYRICTFPLARLRCNNDICCWLYIHLSFIFLDDFSSFFEYTIHYFRRFLFLIFVRLCMLFHFQCTTRKKISNNNNRRTMFAFSFSCVSGFYFIFFYSLLSYFGTECMCARCVQMCVMWVMLCIWFVVRLIQNPNESTDLKRKPTLFHFILSRAHLLSVTIFIFKANYEL